MAGRTRKETAVVVPSAALVASAVRYSGGKPPRIYQGAKDWQKDAYRHYAICGEARYAANYFGNMLSKATLYAAEVDSKGREVPVKSGSQAATVLDSLFNGRESQASMLKAFGIHLTIAGECYLIGRTLSDQEIEDMAPGTDVESEVWEVASVAEVSVTGAKWSVTYAENRKKIDLAEDDVVIRIWNPMPGARMEADSPFRSLLPILTEVEYLTRHIFAQVSSRLTGAGILWVPQGMSFPPPPEQVDADGKPMVLDNEADQFMATLAEALLTPMNDPGSPAGVVPVVASVPDDMVDKAKLMHFWSNLDEKALEMRNDAILRFARGMDLPPEKVLGMSSNSGSGGGTSNGVSHWGAWQIDEDAVTLHAEPTLEIICNALTIYYTRPLTSGSERVRPDTTSLRLRPDRSKEAIMLWDRGVISNATLLREVGFADGDALDVTSDEFRFRLLFKVAGGSSTPEQVQAALKELGVDLTIPEDPANQSPPREARPAPSLEDKPTRDIPEAAALFYACEPLVYRALERAGNRLRAACKDASPACASYETHTFIATKDVDYVLTDAWSTAGLTLSGVTENPDGVIKVLDGYCRSLIEQQAAHTRHGLQTWLGLVLENAS